MSLFYYLSTFCVYFVTLCEEKNPISHEIFICHQLVCTQRIFYTINLKITIDCCLSVSDVTKEQNAKTSKELFIRPNKRIDEKTGRYRNTINIFPQLLTEHMDRLIQAEKQQPKKSQKTMTKEKQDTDEIFFSSFIKLLLHFDSTVHTYKFLKALLMPNLNNLVAFFCFFFVFLNNFYCICV